MSSADKGKQLPAKFCSFCKETFRPKRKWQLFCSNSCRIRHFAQIQQETADRDAKRRQELENENLALRKEVETLQSQLSKLQ